MELLAVPSFPHPEPVSVHYRHAASYDSPPGISSGFFEPRRVESGSAAAPASGAVDAKDAARHYLDTPVSSVYDYTFPMDESIDNAYCEDYPELVDESEMPEHAHLTDHELHGEGAWPQDGCGPAALHDTAPLPSTDGAERSLDEPPTLAPGVRPYCVSFLFKDSSFTLEDSGDEESPFLMNLTSIVSDFKLQHNVTNDIALEIPSLLLTIHEAMDVASTLTLQELCQYHEYVSRDALRVVFVEGKYNTAAQLSYLESLTPENPGDDQATNEASPVDLVDSTTCTEDDVWSIEDGEIKESLS
ncbi:uncharacterized protein BJ171DRAFT_523025 [Polychytrium aggregatum]|uniref:uncharacterized protein n=1 Tax=Polychytrium aggregatum TaxID=110093 RepID=UPI0022FE1BD3|nr:uncharacterized protein BJ171DRAFT_523025 [Polychytrium aggregatum]KAI9197067.1 hypothetical protein BJ171DRAFT_523025 [Polychytrium aggregatum]